MMMMMMMMSPVWLATRPVRICQLPSCSVLVAQLDLNALWFVADSREAPGNRRHTHTHTRSHLKGTSVEIRGGSEECTSSSRPLAFACSRPVQVATRFPTLGTGALDPFDCFFDCSSHRHRAVTHTFFPLFRPRLILIDVPISTFHIGPSPGVEWE
ncbi:hypothetical protein BDP55DRAFT_663742 [Colletotrichum godetiae]|uniref:Uncharacterized protein n=1 Tax=Colletotrichum godetiae TaxID=1209918 RepID=A0AAJ0AM60_9PEZI|nr:uncharacterized protein BDP55DRAFT_663742 [Colletotrichum godetiae]KAK1675794.1 hypothetical protein BDP55DRAFT_663742 [Colletotrichum godetiae]